MSDKVRRLPVRPKDSTSVLLVAPPFTGCPHTRAIVDEKLAELTCADCGERLNPMTFLVKLAKQETSWGWQQREIAKAREELDARSRCRCTHCGELTPIRTVHNREVKRIKSKRTPR